MNLHVLDNSYNQNQIINIYINKSINKSISIKINNICLLSLAYKLFLYADKTQKLIIIIVILKVFKLWVILDF